MSAIETVIQVHEARSLLKSAISGVELQLEEAPSLTLARRLGALQAAQASLAEAMAAGGEVPDDG